MSAAFQILADPTRRRLVEALRAGEQSVGQLVEVVDIGQPGVSRQLAILQEANFVRVRPEGRRRLYRLVPTPFQELDEWMQGYRGMWEGRLDRLGAALEKDRGDRRQKRRPKRTGNQPPIKENPEP